MSFKKLFAPQSVAVVGASANESKVGFSVLKNLVSDGFSGNIYPVNPKAESILDIKCYKSLLDIDGDVDCAVIVVPRDGVVPVMQECVKKSISSLIIITAGFAESDDKGKRLQQEIAQIARSNKMTVLGPNCLGLINPWTKMNASFGQAAGEPGSIAIMSQSGALITAIQDWAARNRIGFSIIASIGNKACVDEVDFLENLKRDNNTKVIAAYLEDISHGQKFMRVAEVVGKEKPIIILKSGRTQSGAKAASSHTGSLAGADAAYACAFERTGVVRVDSIEHLFDVSSAFAYQPLPKGDRMAILTNAGGPGIMMSDALEMAGLTVTRLDRETKDKLLKIMPSAGSPHNPVDILGDADGKRYRDAMKILLASDAVDGLLVILTPQKMTEDVATARAMVEISAEAGKPVMACFMGGDTIGKGIKILQENRIPQYSIPERAARAMREMVLYNSYKNRPLRVVERFAINKNPVIKIIKAYRNRGLNEIGEVDSKTIMKAYNFDMPPGMLASDVDEATRLADQLGYPLAMKISSPDILHKSDVGGVRIGLDDRGDVEDVFELMMLRIGRKMPDAEIRGVLLEKMVAGGQEVILGMNKDPQFGPMLMFGLGGIFVEVLRDVTFSLAPVTREEAFQMIQRTKTYKLLTGVRGKPSVDISAIIDNIVRMSQLVMDFPEIEEIDINPLKVGYEGEGASVVDARIIITKE
ncbi:MAG: CoA-binding protein [Chitinivibrionales bacterium]|nr:CoA-binding protein [Chitinivibrionales bacterium]